MRQADAHVNCSTGNGQIIRRLKHKSAVMASPSAATVKRLYAVAGDRCAFPKCTLPLIDDASGKVTRSRVASAISRLIERADPGTTRTRLDAGAADDCCVAPHGYRPSGPLLQYAGRILREESRQYLRADSCIASTWLGMQVLALLHVRAMYALVVEATVSNRLWWDRLKAAETSPSTAERQKWIVDGGWSLGVGVASSPPRLGGWNGHLVAIVSRRWLWDLSIDQASRPEKGLQLPPCVVAPVDEAFLRGKRTLVGEFENGVITYDARPGDRTYQASPNWDYDPRPAPIVTRTIERLRSLTAAK